MEVEGSEEGEGEVEETGQGRKTKTGRNVRFSHDENCVLVHNIIPCYEVILGNLAARTPLRRRHQLWGRVCEAVNAVGPLKRTVAHCRKRFSDIKRRLKEKMAQERRSTRRTGGGPPLRMEYTTYEEELRQIMPAEIVEGINVQDTDSPSFGQVVDSPGPQFSPSARPTPPPSARDSGTDEQAGPSSYQPPQAESLEMSPEPEDLTTITLVTVDAPVSGLQEVSPGAAEPSHHQPAPETMDPAREMALSIGAFQQQQTLFMDRQTGHMSQIAAQLRRIHRSTSQIPAAINRLASALEQTNVQLAQMSGSVDAMHSSIREGNANVIRLAGQLQQELIARLPAPFSSASTSAASTPTTSLQSTPPRRGARTRGGRGRGESATKHSDMPAKRRVSTTLTENPLALQRLDSKAMPLNSASLDPDVRTVPGSADLFEVATKPLDLLLPEESLGTIPFMARLDLPE
ncbi:uncharacterized protein LOC142150764 [Mixophyes fleayi]|uniref:uncharacterized protein LOC142150764 n=1 Tax=Mixophyes fleayi TaxID=3061075 RepID=UPI003F4DACD7